jgi:L-cysteine:1D-myo-inositol 2-amino-2-deoxy-alpha-D-glucopyranoside ligase
MYVCGITPYDATHIGHANTYVAFDLINRMWRDSGHTVRYVQNVTDIDDPLLARAIATGNDWRAIADREIASFRKDMSALRVIPPNHYIGAVEAIPSVVTHVQRLLGSGDVYRVDDDLYFRVRSDPRFGTVAGLSEDIMRMIFAERGGDPERPGKDDPLDCLVWQSVRPGEPSWQSALGPGRPGWHIECAAIALDYLRTPIDVQGGGSDLAFPHHEMGAAEAQRLTGQAAFARLYVHSGMVSWQGHKMSKSRGNLVLVATLRSQGVDPIALRLALVAHHYRSDWAWTPRDLEGAMTRLEAWRAAARRPTSSPAEPLLEAVRACLADDLHTPSAIDAIDEWVRRDGHDSAGPALMADTVNSLLGVELR